MNQQQISKLLLNKFAELGKERINADINCAPDSINAVLFDSIAAVLVQIMPVEKTS